MPTSATSRRAVLKTLAALGLMPPALALAGNRPTVEEVAFDPHIPVLGNPHGNVTVVEFLDYQCSICKLAYSDLQSLLNEDPNVRIVFKDWPILGDISNHAARAVLATIAQGKYAQAVHALLSASGGLNEARVFDLFSDAGIDVATARANQESQRGKIDALLNRNAMQALAFELRGTPGFVVGSTLFRRRLNLAGLRLAIQKARARGV